MAGTGNASYDGPILAQAVTKTFATRGTAILAEPVALTGAFANEAAKQAQWQAFVRKSRLHAAPASFAEVVETIADFLGPIAGALAVGKRFQGTWKAPGPWREGAG